MHYTTYLRWSPDQKAGTIAPESSFDNIAKTESVAIHWKEIEGDLGGIDQDSFLTKV